MAGALSYNVQTLSFPGDNFIQPLGINNADDAGGFYLPTADTSIGVLDTGAIGTIDNAGEIVGLYVDANGVQLGHTDMGGVFSSVDAAGSVNTAINGVNSAEQIVGFATLDHKVVGFAATPPPDRASCALLGIAGISLMLVRVPRWRGAREHKS